MPKRYSVYISSIQLSIKTTTKIYCQPKAFFSLPKHFNADTSTGKYKK